MTVRTLDVLRLFGFSDNNTLMGLVWNFGTGEVTAVECVAHKGLRVYMDGFWRTNRRMGEIDYPMPVEVDSFEQGKAWVAYVLHHVHHVAFRERPSWIEEGLALKHLLPWEQARERAKARFTCAVPQKFLRVALTDLRRLAKNATERDLVSFEFDGRVLTLTAMGERTEIAARGEAWDRPYCLPLISFRLGIRLDHAEPTISIYDARFQIYRYSFSLSDGEGPPA